MFWDSDCFILSYTFLELNKNNSCLCSHIYRSLATLDLEGHLLLIRTTKSKGPQKLTNCQRILTKKMWSPSPFVQVEVSRENQTNVFTDLCSPASYCSPIIWRSHNIFRMNSVTSNTIFKAVSFHTFLNVLLLRSSHPHPFSIETSHKTINFDSLKCC